MTQPLPIPENNSHPPVNSLHQRQAIRGMGARRSLPHGAHKTVPRHRGEEDRSASSSPGGRVGSSVREGAHPPALPSTCDS